MVGVDLGEFLFFSAESAFLASAESFFSGVRLLSDAESGRPMVSHVLANRARGFFPSAD